MLDYSAPDSLDRQIIASRRLSDADRDELLLNACANRIRPVEALASMADAPVEHVRFLQAAALDRG